MPFSPTSTPSATLAGAALIVPHPAHAVINVVINAVMATAAVDLNIVVPPGAGRRRRPVQVNAAEGGDIPDKAGIGPAVPSSLRKTTCTRKAMTVQRPSRSANEQERLESTLRELFERMIAFNQLLGLEVESLDPASARMRFGMRPDLIGHYPTGRLHGGVIASVLDATGGLALMCGIAEKHRDETTTQVMTRFGRFGTIDLRTDFLRPGIGQHFVAM